MDRSCRCCWEPGAAAEFPLAVEFTGVAAMHRRAYSTAVMTAAAIASGGCPRQAPLSPRRRG